MSEGHNLPDEVMAALAPFVGRPNTPETREEVVNALLGVAAPYRDKVVEAVREDLLRRSQHGLKKYGVGVDRTDLTMRQWMQHHYEELLDAANYAKRIMMEMDGAAPPAPQPKPEPTPDQVEEACRFFVIASNVHVTANGDQAFKWPDDFDGDEAALIRSGVAAVLKGFA